MPHSQILSLEGAFPLPPLILHPFTESAETLRMLEKAKASLAMLRDGELNPDESEALERRLLEGRFTEFRMLFYVGKDIVRWLEQCVEACEREADLQRQDLPPQSFADLLIEQTPPEVAAKLREWGVVEYSRIFARSIGIYTQFCTLPHSEQLQTDYLRYYYRYADFAYAAWQELRRGPRITQRNFPFTLYASGEYARMLEDEWNGAGA